MNPTFALTVALLFALSPITIALAQGDPAAVAQRYVEAVNSGNVTAIAALFTDDALVAHGRVCTPPCVGDPAAVRRQYEQDVANGVKLTIVDTHISEHRCSPHGVVRHRDARCWRGMHHRHRYDRGPRR
jgi:SnoaL-like domain